MSLSSRKQLLEEAGEELARIRASLRRPINEVKATPSREAILAAKFFKRSWELWYVDHGDGPMADVLGYNNDMCYDIDLMTKGICDAVENPNTATFNEFAVAIQSIVNAGKTSVGDFADSIKLSDYLEAVPNFVEDMDILIGEEDDTKSKYDMKRYKADIVKFSKMLLNIPRSTNRR